MKKRNSKGQFSKTKISEFGFVNLSTYTSPEIKEVKGADWIEYGADNNYFQFLIDRYNGSPTNNAAINGISQAIYGKGLNATDSSRKPNEYAQMISLFRKDVVRRCCYDLKLMGQAAIQVIYSKDRSKIVQLEHMPIETLRAEKCNDNGDIPAYYYYNDWANIKRTDKPLRIPAFGMSKESIEIYYIKPYKSGFYYYSPVDYQGGLQYCELEEEVSNYHINNIRSGLSPSMLINFNNGTPNQQERQLIETKIAQKFSGTNNAGKFIIAFNDNKESQAEITPVQLSDAHNQYQFLSEESTQKIQIAHRIVSPFLLGIKTSSGFSSNADEIKTASILMDNTVIRPFQELLIDSFDNILAYNDISLNLYFTTLQPLEFTEVDSLLQDKETIEEETGVEMSVNLKKIDGKDAYKTIEEAEAKAKEQNCEGHHEHEEDGIIYYMPCKSHNEVDLKKTDLDDFIKKYGEDEDLSEWELIDERKVNYDDEKELDTQIKELNKKKKSTLSKIWNFVSTGTARPNAKSEQDEDIDGVEFKVRYQYAPLKDTFKKGKNVTRAFCKKMILAKKIYRKEDIEQMSNIAVNPGWGPRGADTYSIWLNRGGQKTDLYKGGGACHHFWMRKTYMKKGKGQIDIKSPLAPVISVNKARKEGFVPEVNDRLVAERPIDMTDKGFLD
tara:strand:- start:3086 stop:5092 length:2007 start_codon:yes stop_codon:yes gene_type:complete